ncbi:MAG: hypothetical protein HY286_17395 [Planctomycetes bacterium]|nr:hypothetical protein [Planctomycetota bacterium]
MRANLRRILWSLLGLFALAAGFVIWQIGPRNIVGLLFYDQRREVQLKVGDAFPDVALEKLDGGEEMLSKTVGERPLVIVFGSFT